MPASTPGQPCPQHSPPSPSSPPSLSLLFPFFPLPSSSRLPLLLLTPLPAATGSRPTAGHAPPRCCCIVRGVYHRSNTQSDTGTQCNGEHLPSFPFPSFPFLFLNKGCFVHLLAMHLCPTCRSTPTQQASDSEAHGSADAAALSRQVEELKLNLSVALRELDDTRAALQTHRNQQQQQQQQRQQHGMALGGLSGSERSQQREALTGASMDGAGASRCELCFAVLLLLFAESVLFPCCEREGKGGSVLC